MSKEEWRGLRTISMVMVLEVLPVMMRALNASATLTPQRWTTNVRRR